MFQKYRKKIWRAIGVGGVSVVVLSFVLWGRSSDDDLVVRFLDVGQGDAILLSQGSAQVLIDGGKDPRRTVELLGQYLPFWDRTLEAVVATHPDEDHIGGLTGVFDRYRVEAFLRTDAENDTRVYARLVEASRDVERVETFAPLRVAFPGGAEMRAIFPEEGVSTDAGTNETSIVTRLVFGDQSFLLTGDLPNTQEAGLLAGKTKVLKVGHHGSKHSTSDALLDAISPEYAVVSVGAKNRYGHPAPEVTDRLRAYGVEILRTDESGTITFVCKKDVEKCKVVTER